MNVGNQIWDPASGGKPSIKLFPEYSSGDAMRNALVFHEEEVEAQSVHASETKSDKKSHPANRQEEVDAQPASSVCVRSDRDAFSGSSMAALLGGSAPPSDSWENPSSVTDGKCVVDKAAPPVLKTGASAECKAFVQANLYRSAREGNIKLVKIAIESDGADINGQNPTDNSWSVLHYAAHGGCFRLVQYLLQVDGIDVTLKDANGSSPADVAKNQDIKELIDAFSVTTSS